METRLVTYGEWIEVVAWLKSSWPTFNWSPETVKSVYTEFRKLKADVVLEAARALFAAGSDFPPTPSRLMRVATDTHPWETAPALPAHTEDYGWAEFSQRQYGEQRSLSDVIRERHASLPCRSPLCDIHG